MRRRRIKRYSWIKRAWNRSGHPVIRFIHFLVIHCPLKISIYLSEKLGTLSYYVFWGYRRKALRNLDVAFGSRKSREEQKEIALNLAKNLCKGFIEMLYSTGPYKKKIADKITLEGKENLDKALVQGRGVLAVSAHIGNFAILGFGLVRSGYQAQVVIKAVDDEGIEKIFQEYRRRQGAEFIYTRPPQECLKNMLDALRDNEIVCLLVDQDKRRTSVLVDFLGKPAATSVSPAVIALRTGSPIVPIFIVRAKDDTHRIFIEPPIEIDMSSKQEERVVGVTAEINKVVQSYVEKYPGQWSWLNRRWEVKPKVRKKKKKELLPMV